MNEMFSRYLFSLIWGIYIGATAGKNLANMKKNKPAGV